MDKAFLLPLGFVVLGIGYCLLRSRPWLSSFLVAMSVSLFPAIFWAIRNRGPFFGGADIGAGLVLLLSSFVASILVVIVFSKARTWAVSRAAKYAACILGFNFSIAMINHFMLLEQHKDYKQKSELNCNEVPFHCAIKNNKIEEIKILKQAGRSLEAKDGWGRTALFHAYYSNINYEFINELLKHGADANQPDSNGEPLIRIALSSSPPNYKLADLLLLHGAQVNLLFGTAKKSTLLNDAVIRKSHDLVNYLMNKGANPKLKDDYGYNACERIKVHSIEGLTELESICR